SKLAAGVGSLQLGLGSAALPTTATTTRSTDMPKFYETIRTGAGSIDIYTGRDVQLIDPLATIYTAGSRSPDLADFTAPTAADLFYANTALGTAQTPFVAAQYSQNGGDVTIMAQGNIAHQTNAGA